MTEYTRAKSCANCGCTYAGTDKCPQCDATHPVGGMNYDRVIELLKRLNQLSGEALFAAQNARESEVQRLSSEAELLAADLVVETGVFVE